MKVDVHTHIPTHRDDVPAQEVRSDPLIGRGASLTGSLPEYTDAISVMDRAIVFGIAARPGSPEPPVLDWRAGWPGHLNQNDIAAEVAATDPDRLVPFMSLHPEQPDLDDEYDRAVGDRLRGGALSRDGGFCRGRGEFGHGRATLRLRGGRGRARRRGHRAAADLQCHRQRGDLPGR